MALNSIAYVPPPDKVTTSSGRKGGGRFGTLAGLAGGAAIGGALLSGGVTAPIAAEALGATAGGASLGGLLGETIRPTRQASSAVERRLQSTGPELIHSDTSAKLRDSLMALHEAPPQIKQQYSPQLLTAYMTSLANDNTPGGTA